MLNFSDTARATPDRSSAGRAAMGARAKARHAAAVIVLALLHGVAAHRNVLGAAGALGASSACLAKVRSQLSEPPISCPGAPAAAVVHPRVAEFHLIEDLLAALLGGQGNRLLSGALSSASTMKAGKQLLGEQCWPCTAEWAANPVLEPVSVAHEDHRMSCCLQSAHRKGNLQ